MATPLTNAVPRTSINHIDGLLQGSKWSSPNLTYSLWTDEYSWTDYGKNLFASALRVIESYTNLRFSFIETNGNPHLSTDLEAMLTGSNLQYNFGGAIGMGIFPDTNIGNGWLSYLGVSRSQWPSPEGAIFYDNEAYPYLYGLQPSGEGWAVIMHEILHALGLKHPHDDGGNGRPTFDQLGIGWANDQYYTVMSYNPTNRASVNSGNPATPMAFDVAALQHLYGANMSTYAGNDTHLFEDDGVNGTLWDAGGIDWVDASPLAVGAVINLNPGAFSYTNNTYAAIAYNVTLENVFGSYYADTIYGNYTGNVMHGLSGTDLIRGGGGNDTIHGGYTSVDPVDVNDTIYGDEGADTIYGNGGSDLIYGGIGAEETTADERDVVYGGYGADTIYGGAGDDFIAGGGGKVDPGDLGDFLDGGSGFDYMLGNGGNDTLVGGAGDDVLYGGVGDDVYVTSNGHGLTAIMQFEGAGVAGGDFVAFIGSGAFTTAQSLIDLMRFADRLATFDLGDGDRITIADLNAPLTAGDILIV